METEVHTNGKRPERPPRMPIIPNEIPQELRDMRRWLVWKWVWRNKRDKYDKPPMQVNGKPASSTDPATWTTFQSAGVAALHRFDGVGYTLGTDIGIVGIDIDNCRDPGSEAIREPAASIIKKMDTYSEVSPSGTGVKMLVHAKLPEKCRKANHAVGIEVYGDGRYFTITGHRLPDTTKDINDRQEQVEWLIATFLHASAQSGGKRKKKTDDIETARSALTGLHPSRSDGYWDWLQVGMALHSVDVSLLRDWDAWSRTSGKYKQGDCAEKWNSFGGSGIGLGTLFYFAKQDGWRPPKTELEERCLDSITNCEVVEGEDGNETTIPLSMPDIIANIHDRTDNWPRRVSDALFIHDEQGISYLKTESHLFGYFHSRGPVDWARGRQYVTKAELFSELQRSGSAYDLAEFLPHEPLIKTHYYAYPDIQPGDGSHLQQLIDRFSPATEIDRDLILAAFLTPGWGGPPGTRPAFVVTSDHGRGIGKTTLAETVGSVWGGTLTFSHREEISKIKTRLLTPDAIKKRVCLLDNVKSFKFSWSELEAMITASSVGGHRMYFGEGARPNTLTWFITLNGASLSTDMAQRSVIIKLRKPDRSGSWSDETRQFVEQHRDEIIGDMIGILRSDPCTLDRFSRWATWEREVLARVLEPSYAQEIIDERQIGVDVEAEEAETIEGFFADQLRWLGYDVEREWVFIPSAVANRWYCRGQNDRATTSQTTRILKQLASEGRLKHIREHRMTTSKGFLWTTDQPCLHVIETGLVEGFATDIEKRTAKKLQEQENEKNKAQKNNF